jgi:hypothetical protein
VLGLALLLFLDVDAARATSGASVIVPTVVIAAAIVVVVFVVVRLGGPGAASVATAWRREIATNLFDGEVAILAGSRNELSRGIGSFSVLASL